MDEFATSTRGTQAGRLERVSMVVGAVAAFVAIVLAWLLAEPYAYYAAIGGLVVECLGLGLGTFLSIKRDWRMLSHARRDLAETMDIDFLKYEELIERLRSFPAQARAQRHRYLRSGSERMLFRTRLFTGAFDKLGVIPLLAALYVQARDLGSISLAQGVLVLGLVLSHLAFWHFMYVHARVDALNELLSEAAERDRLDGAA